MPGRILLLNCLSGWSQLRSSQVIIMNMLGYGYGLQLQHVATCPLRLTCTIILHSCDRLPQILNFTCFMLHVDNTPYPSAIFVLLHQDVFLRELVSNAADACDKKRFLALTNSDAPPEPMKLRINSDKARLSHLAVHHGFSWIGFGWWVDSCQQDDCCTYNYSGHISDRWCLMIFFV